MAKIRIVGDSSGYVEIAASNAAGNNTLELPSGNTRLVGSDSAGNVSVSGIVTAASFSGNVTGNVNSSGVTTVTTLRATSIVGVTTAGITTAYIGRVLGDCLATPTHVAGVSTTGITTSGSLILTLTNSTLASSISNGDYVTGIGITAGTTIISGGGTTQLTLSQTAGISSSVNAVNFYTQNKVLTPGSVGGQLCRAWVNFDGVSATPRIRAAYNVSSITDIGAGSYNVNFTTALPDTNYAVNVNVWSANTAMYITGSQVHVSGRDPTTSRFNIGVSNSTALGADNGSGFTDVPYVFASVFR